jgi:arsenate reductase
MGKTHFGYLITVCEQAEERCPSTFPGIGNRLFWDFENPEEFVSGSEEEKVGKFRQVRDQIRDRIAQWIAEQNL